MKKEIVKVSRLEVERIKALHDGNEWTNRAKEYAKDHGQPFDHLKYYLWLLVRPASISDFRKEYSTGDYYILIN